MSLQIEQTDLEGRAIFFKGEADVSKAEVYNTRNVQTQELVNLLFNKQKTPEPKFKGFVFNYSPFLIIYSVSSRNRQKIKAKVNYDIIRDVYPCEADSNVCFIVTNYQSAKCKLRVFRFKSPTMATKMRYVIDQLQINSALHMNKNCFVDSYSPDTRFVTANNIANIDGPLNNQFQKGAHRVATPIVEDFDDSHLKLPRLKNPSIESMPIMRPPRKPNSGLDRQRRLLKNNDEFDISDYRIYLSKSRNEGTYPRSQSAFGERNQTYQSRKEIKRIPLRSSEFQNREFADDDLGYYTGRKRFPMRDYEPDIQSSFYKEDHQIRSASVPRRRYREL